MVKGSFEAATLRMNFKAWNFERLALMFWGGRGAQVGKTSVLDLDLYGASVDVGRIYFYLERLRPWDPTKTLDMLEED